MAAKKLSLEEHASQVRSELNVPRQSELFKTAVEAGYLAARADGNVDDTEREVIVQAVELLSEGLVLEWETEQLLDDCEAKAKDEGAEKRAETVGATLKELDQAEVGLLVAALVARATNGVEKSEAEVLKAIGKAAGLGADKVKNIVKRAIAMSAAAT